MTSNHDTADDQFGSGADDRQIAAAWRAYDATRRRISARAPEDAAMDPSGSMAVLAFCVIYGAGCFAIGYLSGVYGWVAL